MPPSKLSVILHGGAGNFQPDYTPKKLPGLKQALDRAWTTLSQGAPGHLAVCAALQCLEQDQYFNAGYGAFPNQAGEIFLDIGLMSGTRSFVSFLNVRHMKYPSQLAQDSFAEGQQLMCAWSPKRAASIQSSAPALKERYGCVDSDEQMLAPIVRQFAARNTDHELAEENHGTVGCVVRDAQGCIYAGTSTGGIGGKVDGRIGDSPIVGAGVYADNEICGLSTSGHGEAILATTISAFVISRLRQANLNSHAPEEEQALAEKVLKEEMYEFKRKSGEKDCGMILLTPSGTAVYDFCSPMFAVALRSGDNAGIAHEEVKIALKN